MYTKALAAFVVLTLATAAGAKMKVRAEHTCAKPDPVHSIEVKDRPEHVFQIGKMKCTFTEGTQLIKGIDAVGFESTFFVEITGKTGRSHGVVVETLSNGDNIFFTFQGKSTAEGGESRWTITGGTGKFTGIKGKGTTKITPAADGTETGIGEGTYTLPK